MRSRLKLSAALVLLMTGCGKSTQTTSTENADGGQSTMASRECRISKKRCVKSAEAPAPHFETVPSIRELLYRDENCPCPSTLSG